MQQVSGHNDHVYDTNGRQLLRDDFQVPAVRPHQLEIRESEQDCACAFAFRRDGFSAIVVREHVPLVYIISISASAPATVMALGDGWRAIAKSASDISPKGSACQLPVSACTISTSHTHATGR
jgi:hypothetical protein